MDIPGLLRPIPPGDASRIPSHDPFRALKDEGHRIRCLAPSQASSQRTYSLTPLAVVKILIKKLDRN